MDRTGGRDIFLIYSPVKGFLLNTGKPVKHGGAGPGQKQSNISIRSFFEIGTESVQESACTYHVSLDVHFCFFCPTELCHVRSRYCYCVLACLIDGPTIFDWHWPRPDLIRPKLKYDLHCLLNRIFRRLPHRVQSPFELQPLEVNHMNYLQRIYSTFALLLRSFRFNLICMCN